MKPPKPLSGEIERPLQPCEGYSFNPSTNVKPELTSVLPEEKVKSPSILYEYSFHAGSGYTVRIIETEPGIVHFEQGQHSHGGPAVLEFERTEKPMGCANEILQLHFMNKELFDELSLAIRDATVLVHAYETDNRPPANILYRYGKRAK